MNEAVTDIFDRCLAQLATGATVEECLVAHPKERAALEPLPRVATHLQVLPRPDPLSTAAQAALATRVLAQVSSTPMAARPPLSRPRAAGRMEPSAWLAGALRTLGYHGPLAQPWLRRAATALALVLALVLAFMVYVAARAIFPDPSAALAPATTFSLAGMIDSVHADALVVAGITVDLGPQTVITGTPGVGASVHVHGQIRDDGTLMAESVVVNAPAVGASPVATATAQSTVGAASAPALPTAGPTNRPEPTAAPAPASDLWTQLRQLLEAGQADGRAGRAGHEFFTQMRAAEQTYEKGDGEKAGNQLRDLYQKLRENVKDNKTNPGFAQEAQALIAAIGETYHLSTVPDQEGGGNGNGNGNGNGKDDKKDKE
jgi:Domain of unknown function (DUF5666)